MKPRLFIGSSVEGLAIAQAVELTLQHSVHCFLWSNAFPLAEGTVDSLLKRFEDVDYGLFVLSPDDRLEQRSEPLLSARDNVLFEAGLFMGRHGKSRTFLLRPRDVDLHIPTDLIGITAASYEGRRIADDLANALSAGSTAISLAIAKVEAQERQLDFHTFAADEPGRHWPLKAHVVINNNTGTAVALRSVEMKLVSGMKRDRDVQLRQNRLVPEFNAGQVNGNDVRSATTLLNAGAQAHLWVPIAPSTGSAAVRAALEAHRFAEWRYEEHWLDQEGYSRTRVRDI